MDKKEVKRGRRPRPEGRRFPKSVSLKLTKYQYDNIVKTAENMGITPPAVIRLCISRWLGDGRLY